MIDIRRVVLDNSPQAATDFRLFTGIDNLFCDPELTGYPKGSLQGWEENTYFGNHFEYSSRTMHWNNENIIIGIYSYNRELDVTLRYCEKASAKKSGGDQSNP